MTEGTLTRPDGTVIAYEDVGRGPVVVLTHGFMAERIAGARKVAIPGAGHLANLDQPAAFNAAVLDFLGDLPR